MSDSDDKGIAAVRNTLDGIETVAPVDGLSADPGGAGAPDLPDDGGGPGFDTQDPGYNEAPPIDQPPQDAGDDPFLYPEGAKFPTNDTGNGQRFVLYYGDDIMFVPRVGWHVFDGKRWKLDPDQNATRSKAQLVQHRIVEEIRHLTLDVWQVAEIAKEPSLRAAFDELLAIEDKERSPDQKIKFDDLAAQLKFITGLKDRRSKMKGEHRTFAKSSGNSGKIDAMMKEGSVHLAREIEDLDSDPLTINTESGILRFTVDGGDGAGFSKVATFGLEEHAREASVTGQNRPQYITKMIAAEYDPKAKCPNFDAFLERVQPDQEIRSFLQRWFGLSLSGLPYQGFAFLYGDGANGKSVLVELMSRLAGDYAAKAKIESLTGHNRRGGGDATPDLIGIMGARLAHASEPEEGQKLQEAIIKELTGGEKMMVRRLHDDFFEVTPYFKLTISGNYKPEIRGTDDGIWRRVKLVPFDVQIPRDERDENLGEKLFAERSGILNWLIDGLMDYLEGGLQEPDQILDATNEYRAESDPIRTFLGECCVVHSDADFMTARDLINAFNFWLESKGDPRWERKASLAFKRNAGRYRDSDTGQKYAEKKRAVTGYAGLKFKTEFQDLLATAVLDSKGRPSPNGRKDGDA